MSVRLTRRAIPLLAALLGCATAEIQPPARTTVHVAAGPGLDVELAHIILSEDMLVDEASDASRLVFWIELENHDAAPTRVDPQASRLIVRTPGAAETRLPPTSSGWGQVPLNEPPRQALALDLRPHEQRRAWVAFELPAAIRDSSAPQPSLVLSVDVEGTPAEIVVASPSGPRWVQPTVGPLHGAVSNTTLLAPSLVADALGLSLDFIPHVRLTTGPLFARHDGHFELGFGGTFQIDSPVHFQPSPSARLTPFLSLELAFAVPSYPTRYMNEDVTLSGAAAGVELSFGALRPPNADRLPLEYPWPLAPFTLRLAYVRWWGEIDHGSFGNAGRSGLIASLTVRFAP